MVSHPFALCVAPPLLLVGLCRLHKCVEIVELSPPYINQCSAVYLEMVLSNLVQGTHVLNSNEYVHVKITTQDSAVDNPVGEVETIAEMQAGYILQLDLNRN
jgi:hypothetical protein